MIALKGSEALPKPILSVPRFQKLNSQVSEIVKDASNKRGKWQEFLGEYGWDHNKLFVMEKKGDLFFLIEWFYLYPLTHIEGDIFRFPRFSMYENEEVIFNRNSNGKIVSVSIGGKNGILFKRRNWQY
jgi:hypothetical protein